MYRQRPYSDLLATFSSRSKVGVRPCSSCPVFPSTEGSPETIELVKGSGCCSERRSSTPENLGPPVCVPYVYDLGLTPILDDRRVSEKRLPMVSESAHAKSHYFLQRNHVSNLYRRLSRRYEVVARCPPSKNYWC